MSTSPRKLASTRANAAKSTGPITAAGKAASSLNATIHGLTARTFVLANESHEQFQTELDEYLDHFQPQTKPERELVHQLAAAHWRIQRYSSVEAGLFERKMESQQDWLDDEYEEEVPQHHRLAAAFDGHAGANASLSLLNRYAARLNREYRELLRVLERMQAARIARTTKFPNEANPDSEHLPRLVSITAET